MRFELVHQLEGNIHSFYGAGTETVRSTLVWLFKLVTSCPECQKRIQEELENEIDRDQLPSWSDRSKLIYTQAFINEVQRWASVVPLNLPRR